MQPDAEHAPCPVCGEVTAVAGMQGHLNQKHDRDGGAPNPAPETKAWPPQGIETK